MAKLPEQDERVILRMQLVQDQLQRAPLVLLVIDALLGWFLLRGGAAVLDCAIWLGVSTLVQFLRARVVKNGMTPDSKGVARLSWTDVLACYGAVGVTRLWPIWEVFFNGNGDPYIVSVVLMGQAAGGVGSVAGLLSAYLAWGIPAIGGLMVAWVSRGTFEGHWLAFMLVMMFVMLCLNVRSYGAALDQLRLEVERANSEKQRAETAVQARTRFFASASHDLRQPLGVLRWYGDAVRIHATQLAHDTLLKIGDGVIQAVERAEPLVRQYLEIARLDAGTHQLRPSNLPLVPIFQQVVEAFTPEAQNNGLSLDLSYDKAIEPQLYVKADRDALRNILDNLVGNALKFTRDGGVTLQATLLQNQQAPTIRILVSDTGIGIPADEHERVFEEFYQIGNPQRTHRLGLGLGLAIVKRQAQLMNANIGLNSAPGVGTTIWLDLPAVPADQIQEVQHAHISDQKTAYRPPCKHVLLIDDEEAVRQSLSVMLEALGWTVAVAGNLPQAVNLLSTGYKADALIVDYRLEGPLNGTQVLQQLYQLGFKLPSVFLTGDTSPERLTELAQTGRPVLHKPIDGAHLVQSVLETIADWKSS